MGKRLQETGEFAGWEFWEDEPFENATVGPFYFRLEEKGPVAAFRAERRHMNAGGVVHGGALLAFADYSLFVIAGEAMEGGYGLTVALTSEFLSGPPEGALLEARGEVLRAGRSIVFVRGLITHGDTPCLNFSGTLKKQRPRD